MDLNDMRKKFREKKEQEENTSVSPVVEENSNVNSKTGFPAKSGDSSTVSLEDLSYHYEKGGNNVSFSCSRLDNTSEETTGLLSLCCWISEKARDNGEWQNDNYAFVDSVDLGSLEKGYGFPDVNQNFEIPDNLLKIVNDMNNDADEWHFVFTINELHEDGNKYIIHTINGQNENEGDKLPISDDSLTIIKDQDDNTLVYQNGEEFTGTLYSSDERFEIEFKKSVATYLWCYHSNGMLAVAGNLEDDSTPVYFDEQDNEITEEVFEQKYGDEFEQITAIGFEELESRIEDNSSNFSQSNNQFDSSSSVFSKVKAIVVDKLGVEPYEVVQNASFMNDLGADSLDAVELIMEFEKEFGINIPDEIAERIRTVGDAVRLLEKNV